MPIYEYQCTACHHTFDVLQKISEPPLKTCPKCAKDKAIRLVSAAGFQLKGSGWYATDFKNKSASKSSASDDATNASDTSDKKTTEKASETKTTTKGESD